MHLVSLTPRRLEALATLQRLTDHAGSAVHYSVVAARMRISAWTAYDLLRELEKIGLVHRSTALEPISRRGGRSRVLFAPLAPAAQGLALDAVESLRSSFERFAPIADDVAAIRAYLSDPAADLAFQFGFWLSRLEAAGRQAAEAARAVLESGALPALKIQAVAAMGMGSVLARAGRSRLTSGVTAAATRFSMLIDETATSSDSGLAALVDAARLLQPAPATGAEAAS
jgi:hypothetical protein